MFVPRFFYVEGPSRATARGSAAHLTFDDVTCAGGQGGEEEEEEERATEIDLPYVGLLRGACFFCTSAEDDDPDRIAFGTSYHFASWHELPLHFMARVATSLLGASWSFGNIANASLLL